MISKTKKNQNLIKILLIFILGFFLGILIFGFLILPHAIAPSTSKINSNVINLSSTGDEKMDLYFKAQITAPSSYFVTDDQMLASYDSQGGMAPPRLILMKNYQYIPDAKKENYLKEIWDYNKNDCISIWSTGGIGSVDEWTQTIGQGKYGKSETHDVIKVGERSAQLYKLKLNPGSIYVAWMPVSSLSEGGVSYFFITCNENNKEDLVSIIKSIKFLKDVKY